MKRLFKFATVALLFGFGVTGCYKDIIVPDAAVVVEEPAKAVSFKSELEPLFEKSCALGACHDGVSHVPDLRAGKSYAALTTGTTYINLASPKSSYLVGIINGEMKEYIPSATDRQKVYDWIRNGAPNN
jgi:hypothetical protein